MISHKTLRNIRLLSFAAAICLLPACDMYVPPSLSHSPIQLVSNNTVHEYTTSAVGDDIITAIVDDYRRYGDGPLTVTVTYDPRGSFTAMDAQHNVDRIAGLLSKRAVGDIRIETLPISGMGGQSLTMVTYPSVQAKPPKDCDYLAGYDDRHVDPKPLNYGYGCTTDTLLAKQIANPGDLRGRDGRGGGDGRRQAEMVETYRSGAPLPALPGASSGF